MLLQLSDGELTQIRTCGCEEMHFVFMVLASFQTVSESFQDFSNIFMHNEFSLRSVFPVEYLLAAAEAARVEEKYWRVSKAALSLLFLGAGSEQAC